MTKTGTMTYGFSLTRTVRQNSSFVLLAGFVFLGLVLTLSWLAVRRLLRPLRDMKEVARAFGDTGWKGRVKIKGTDELAELGTNLNLMADRIEDYVASMHRLMAGVSHELRSPLTRMKVALEFVDEPKVKSSLAEEIALLDRMTGILLERERLRTKPGSLNRAPVAIGPWLESLVVTYRVSGLEVRLEGPELVVDLDAERMAMAIRNLVENVVRHAPGSPAILRWQSAATPGRSLVLSCRDEGPGIAPETLEHLGEPFFLADRSRTGNRSRGGYGLGLSLVFSIVEAHGGEVRVENASPRGLKVTLEF